ncbi:hypothetical protein [Amycolatopsis arida]|uniref:hypothetical protein n=1 Tax=Amycolatopsis arida TaxID=587909 RepID=UPI000B846F15|nr:hypothetical protein [Amycolatopsis arida]
MTVPRLRPTKVAYDFPAGGLDPFDVEEPRTQHLYDAGGWSRAWVAGRSWPAPPPGRIHDVIPLPYKSVSLLEKLAVVVNGVVLREWPETGHASATRRLPGRLRPAGLWRDRCGSAYVLIRQSGGARTGFDTYEDAIATAVRPCPHPATWLVGRVLAYRSAFAYR